VFIALGVPGTLQIVIGNVIEPRVMSNSLDINTVAVVFALLFWGTLWGMVGVFLAVPLTAAVKIVLEQLDYTQPMARLLGSRPVPPAGGDDRRGRA
jgi:AI-2 transport protein TqsA